MTKQFYGYGVVRRRGEKHLDVYFPKIHSIKEIPSGLPANSFVALADLSEEIQQSLPCSYKDLLNGIDYKSGYSECSVGVFSLSVLDTPVDSVAHGYFKLQLLSQRSVKPHELNLDALFGNLHNIAWTNKGPVLIEDVESERIKSYSTENVLEISHVDKFPYMVNYHVPEGTRIASGSQVRLGAHLGKGTTVMPAGYINFNAGTEGNAMIEGRVSAGVFVGNDSDVGGGASIMGTLSGGNKDVISIGQQCLLGANAGAGISLGTGCTIAAGLYVYAGMKVSLYNEDDNPIDIEGNLVDEPSNIVKAKELSGRDFLLFIQDSISGKVICKPNKKTIELNTQLHQND